MFFRKSKNKRLIIEKVNVNLTPPGDTDFNYVFLFKNEKFAFYLPSGFINNKMLVAEIFVSSVEKNICNGFLFNERKFFIKNDGSFNLNKRSIEKKVNFLINIKVGSVVMYNSDAKDGLQNIFDEWIGMVIDISALESFGNKDGLIAHIKKHGEEKIIDYINLYWLQCADL